MISSQATIKVLSKGFLRTAAKPLRTRAVVAPTATAHFEAGVDTSDKFSSKQEASCEPYYHYLREVMTPTKPSSSQVRMFSTAAAVVPPSEPYQARHLDPEILVKIRRDLKAVDDNADGTMQPDEFRKLLRLYNSNFSDHEIEVVTEAFYAGTGGRGVALEKFLEALDTAAADGATSDEVAKKLAIGSCGAEYLLGSKRHAYTPEELDIPLTHKPPETLINRMSFQTVKAVRFLFDKATGWNGVIEKSNVMNRVIYLETIAAVPGMVAGILRHFKSLRSMERDGGMLNMFLEEALNERMHLLTFVKMKDPGMLLRGAVLGGQLGFGTFYGLAYIISPKFCHSFVGYVEEEACSTYTKIIDTIEKAPEGSEMAAWRTELAPEIGRSYWHLGEHGTILDLMYAIRADEAEHRDVNHYASDMKPGDLAPVGNPKKQVDMALKKYVKDLMTV